MIRGLYTSGWSMKALEARMDSVANNMTNVNTTGFKRDITIMKTFPDELMKRLSYDSINSNTKSIGSVQSGFDVSAFFTDFSKGQLEMTGRGFDLAINDMGNEAVSFFTVAVMRPDGTYESRHTRNGAFTLNENKMLVTMQGEPVVGENGFIYIPDASFSISHDGSIFYEDKYIDRLRVVSFPEPKNLIRTGTGLFEQPPGMIVTAFSGEVLQGYSESSNASPVNEMMEMMSVARAYEANQKMIQIQDQTLEKAVNEIGSRR